MNLAARGLRFSREVESSRVSSLERLTQARSGWCTVVADELGRVDTGQSAQVYLL